MMRRPRRRLFRRAGFTMLETIVVLAIVSLAVGMGTQLLRPPSGKLKLESATRTLCATLRATRSRAIATNAETSVVIDLFEKSYASPVGAVGRLPAEAEITLDIANTQRLSERRGAISFFPDGTSTGGDVTVLTSAARATIGVNWLTGEARCAVV